MRTRTSVRKSLGPAPRCFFHRNGLSQFSKVPQNSSLNYSSTSERVEIAGGQVQLSAVDFFVVFAKISAGPFDFARCLGQTRNDIVHPNGFAVWSDVQR